MRGLRSMSVAAAVFAASALILLACHDDPETTEPALARIKPDRVLTVTGGGTGSGKVTIPVTNEVEDLVCDITSGTWGTADAGECVRSYPWKTVVTLTATADPTSTFTGWSGACTGTAPTCKVVMTQARSVRANFGGGGTAFFGLNVSGEGTGGGTVQSQANLTPPINCAIAAGSATGPACSAEYASPTVVTLSAQASAGHTFTGWSGDCSGTGSCQLTMSANHAVTARFAAPPGPEATVGRWDAPSSTSVIGLHLSLLRTGRLLLWGHGGQPHTWNPAGGGFSRVTNNTCNGSSCELFCSGHTFLPDGRLLVAGGHDAVNGNGWGLTQASIFDGTSWVATGRMTSGRWYPTLVTLANGDVVAMSGSINPNLNATIPERYNGSSWTQLTGADDNVPLYPRAFLEPKNGWIFYAGEATSRYLDPSGAGRWIGLGGGGTHRLSSVNYGSAVMLDSKVYYLGGGGGSCPSEPENRIEMIDLAAAAPAWTTTGLTPMTFRRRQTNATILPTGQILVTGGTGSCGFTSETGAVFAPEALRSSAHRQVDDVGQCQRRTSLPFDRDAPAGRARTGHRQWRRRRGHRAVQLSTLLAPLPLQGVEADLHTLGDHDEVQPAVPGPDSERERDPEGHTDPPNVDDTRVRHGSAAEHAVLHGGAGWPVADVDAAPVGPGGTAGTVHAVPSGRQRSAVSRGNNSARLVRKRY